MTDNQFKELNSRLKNIEKHLDIQTVRIGSVEYFSRFRFLATKAESKGYKITVKENQEEVMITFLPSPFYFEVNICELGKEALNKKMDEAIQKYHDKVGEGWSK